MPTLIIILSIFIIGACLLVISCLAEEIFFQRVKIHSLEESLKREEKFVRNLEDAIASNGQIMRNMRASLIKKQAEYQRLQDSIQRAFRVFEIEDCNDKVS